MECANHPGVEPAARGALLLLVSFLLVPFFIVLGYQLEVRTCTGGDRIDG